MTRSILVLLLCLLAMARSEAATPASSPGRDAEPPSPAAPAERLAADTPRTTVQGATFMAPAGWSIAVRGQATILEAPEGDSHIALVDVRAADADAAVKAAWAAWRPDAKWPLQVATPLADNNGWQDRRAYSYETSPNERRDVSALALHHGDMWTVAISDVSHGTGEKRLAQISLIYNRLFPQGYRRETFAGRKPHPLDAARIGQLAAFIESAREQLGVPGVALGLIQDGKVVFAGGFGIRELGKPEPVDGDTLFLVASNTKALTTLLLAKLVDEGRLAWDTPVTTLLPSFKLGTAATTSQVQVKHLVCACTGLPRQDFEWLLEFESSTPATALGVLATVQPTSNFGEMFQYSNGLAAAGGFVAGHVAFPDLELGAAYDKAMQARVFDPLGMSATTFDFDRALRGNHAAPHGLDVDGKPAAAVMEANGSIVPMRPAGGVWSNVRDMLRYVAMELARGTLPNGERYIGEAALLARRERQVSVGSDVMYGMGLFVDTTWGIPVLSHGGSLIGYKTDMFFLPDHGIGAVLLTNADPGQAMLSPFKRKLLEVLFDGEPEANAKLIAGARSMQAYIASERERMTVPAAAEDVQKLVAGYHNPALGNIAVSTIKDTRGTSSTWFDFGEWKSEVASRRNPDGTVSFLTISPGMSGLEFVVGRTEGKPTLVFRDAQHEYTFTGR